MNYYVGSFLFVTTLCLFVPFGPNFPMTGLDPSWQFGLNEALAQGLVFGRDIIFSFGPYASIYTKLYHPATDSLMLWGSIFLWAAHLIAIVILSRGLHYLWLVPYVLYLAAASHPEDPIFLLYPFIVTLVAYRLTLPLPHPRRLALPMKIERGTAILFMPLGLLPLIKGTFLLLNGAIILLCFTMFWRRQQRFLALSIVCVPLLTALLLWPLAGQPLLALPEYLLSLAQIVSGYTEAMAFMGSTSAVMLYVIAAVLLIGYVFYSTSSDPMDSRVFLIGTYSVLLFLAMKAGFVRQDGHVAIASTVLVLATILSAILFTSGTSAILVAIVLAASVHIDGRYSNSSYLSAEFVVYRMTNLYFGAWHGFRERLAGDHVLRAQYDEHIAAIRKKQSLPHLTGTTDIYGYQQSALIASGNKWTPRPVLQSYSAYTAVLARLDEAYLRQPNAPDNIVFRVETIDDRFPAMDDGPSWPVLLEKYSLQQFTEYYAVLQRRRTAPERSVLGKVIYQSEHSFDEVVPLPNPGTPLYAEFALEPSTLGKFLAFLYKPPSIKLSVVLNDGTANDFRIVSAMAETGFILSPLIKTTRDFALFSAGDAHYLASKSVREVTVTCNISQSFFWRQTYAIRLRALNIIP